MYTASAASTRAHRLPRVRRAPFRSSEELTLLASIGMLLLALNAFNVLFVHFLSDAVIYAVNAALLTMAARAQMIVRPPGNLLSAQRRWMFWIALLLLDGVSYAWRFADDAGLAALPLSLTSFVHQLSLGAGYLALVVATGERSRRTLVLYAAIALSLSSLFYIVGFHTEGANANGRLILGICLRACFAAAALYAFRSARVLNDRRLAGHLAVFYTVEFFCVLLSNSASVNPRLPFGTPGDILFPLAPFAVILTAVVQQTRTPRSAAPSRPASPLAPLVFTLSLVVCCVPMLHRYPTASGLCLVAALALFSTKLLLVQQQLEHRHRTLAAGHEDLRELAITDPLTGIANRRCFFEALDHALERVQREGGFFSLVMFDIDNLKQINDHQGHLAGDQCLRDFADAINLTIAPAFECFARFGGDEFVLVLPLAGEDDVRLLLDQLRISLATTQVRFSFGMAFAARARRSTATDLLAEADRALYRSRRPLAEAC